MVIRNDQFCCLPGERQNLVEKDKLNTMSFDDIVKKVKSHYASAIMQRYNFNMHTRTEGELVTTYITALRQHCDYKYTLSDMLRDRLVCGVKHKGTLQWNLTHEKAMELALSMESAEKDLQTMQSAPEVHHNTSQKRAMRQPAVRQGVQLSCFRCGDHSRTWP